MNKEKTIIELWDNYINDLFADPSLIEDMPIMFASPYCGTCNYWQLFDEDEMEVMSEVMHDLEYERIRKGMNGTLYRVMQKNGEYIDNYRDYRFFGFCKRYPPLPNDKGQFVIKPKSLLLKDTEFIFEDRFPIIDHKQWCGEWKRSNSYWCERDFLIEMATKNLKRKYSEKEGLPEGWEVFFKD